MFNDGVLVDLIDPLGRVPLLEDGEEVFVPHLLPAVLGRNEVLDHALGDERLGVDLLHEGQVFVARLAEVAEGRLSCDPDDVPEWQNGSISF